MALLQVFLVLVFSYLGVDGAIFTVQNRCGRTIWPGILGGLPQLMNGGFELKDGDSINVTAPTGWSGRFWARDGCSFDDSGIGSCVTGDCGAVLQCDGVGGQPPASLAEFTLNSPLDFYDVSLVDGFNLPVSIIPSGGTGNCSAVQCVSDVNLNCPTDLQVKGKDGRVVACKSACLAFNQPEYCCTGNFSNPTTCKPTSYSEIFKAACPTSYSYPYDDATSTYTCNGANYLIAFC